MGHRSHPAVWTRLIRRVVRPFLTREDQDRISAALAEMSKTSTAEIHVHVVARVGRKTPLAVAEETFHRLGLEKTAHRNGVLILVSHLDHQFAIWGDEGIHAKAGQRLWEGAAAVLREHFAARRYPEGIEACVREVGRELARHFPAR